MVTDSRIPITRLRVDGGACANDYLMQFQSDLLQCEISRPAVVESTALGAAHLAGLAVGFWKDLKELSSTEGETIFKPQMSKRKADHLYEKWQTVVAAARMFPVDD